MKSSFVVLGDLHIKDNQWIKRNIIEGVVNALYKSKDIDEIGLIIAGDLSYSGQANEYKRVGILLSQITKCIRAKFDRDKPIPIYMVPGNHDINFEGGTRDRELVLDIINDPYIDEKVEQELLRFENFYSIAKFNRCFTRDPLVDIRKFKVNFETIQMNLINSELFSTMRDKNGDDDKGIHYFPEEKLSMLNKKKSSKYSITIMHRSPDWFEYNSMKKLKSKITKNSNILIYGHDHVSDLNKTTRKENDLYIINPGKFDFEENEFNFTILNIDSQKEECVLEDYTWSDEDEIFLTKNKLASEIYEINNEGLKPINDFTTKFYSLGNNRLKDIFVFPDLDKIDSKEINSIKSTDEFFEVLKENNIIYIEGDTNSGKTSLCKELYIKSFSHKKVPLYINIEDVGSKKYDRILKEAFLSQYGYEAADREKFDQLSKQEKIVIVDNLEKLQQDKVNDFCVNLESEFGTVIYVYKPSEKASILEDTKKNLATFNCRYKILPFYLRKRKELIGKLIDNSALKFENPEEKIDEINKFIVDQIKVFSIDPSFITKYVDFYVKQNSGVDIHDNIFNKVFESNIVVSLQKVIPNNSIDEYFSVLEVLAYKVHFSKLYPFDVVDINSIVNQYNQDYMLTMDCAKFRTNVINANILEDLGNDKYRFSNNSYLAYFAARAINKKFNNEGNQEDLKWICDNLCFNINGEILLFISYITSNKKILHYIYNNATEIIDQWQELDLDNNKISFLSNRNSVDEKIENPTKEDKDKNEEVLEKQERRIVKNLQVKTKSIYDDYDETKIGSKQYIISQALRYLELVSKILPNFNHDLKRDEKLSLVKSLYSFPNKISYEILSNVDKNLKETIEDLMEYCKIKNLKLTREEIITELGKSSKYFMLNLFDMVARLSVNEKTMPVLDSQELSTINYKLLNVMMHENLGKFKNFATKADALYGSIKNPMVKSMIKIVFRKHFLCNKNLKQIGYVQSIADKYFGNNRKYLK